MRDSQFEAMKALYEWKCRDLADAERYIALLEAELQRLKDEKARAA